MPGLKKIKVILYFDTMHVEGNITITEGFRVSDYFNKEQIEFIPVTEAIIYDAHGNILRKEDFLCVNKDKIIIAKEGIGNE